MFNRRNDTHTHTHHHTHHHSSDHINAEKRIAVLEKALAEQKKYYWAYVGVAGVFMAIGYYLLCKRDFFNQSIFWPALTATAFQFALFYATRMNGRLAVILSFTAIIGSALAIAHTAALNSPAVDTSWIDYLCPC